MDERERISISADQMQPMVAESEALDSSPANAALPEKDTTAADERRSKKIAQKLQRQRQDTPPKRAALVQDQQLDMAQKKAAESQQREVDLRHSLKYPGKENHKELKAMKQRYDLEKNDLVQQVRALSDALDRANESAAEWKEAHASQKDALTAQISQLQAECKAKHQAFVALQLRCDELEASASHRAAAEKKAAAREIEQLRAAIEAHGSERVRLQNALTVSLEDYERLNQQLAVMRKALKDAEEKSKARDCHLELVEREKEILREQVRRKEQLEAEMGQRLAEQARMADAKDAELRGSNAMLSEALDQLRVEVDAFSCTFNQSKDMLEDTVACVERGIESQKGEIERLTDRIREAEAMLQEKDAFWQEQVRAKARELEESHALKMQAWRDAGAREQEGTRRLFQEQHAAFTDRVACLERLSKELQGRLEAERKEREALVREYEDALDELDATLRQELKERLGRADRAFSELEARSLRSAAELRQANAGLAARSEALEKRVAEMTADHAQELQSLEERYLKSSKQYQADAAARIERLEQDVFILTAKNENLNKNMIEILERHRQECAEKSAKLEATRERDEELRQEMTHRFEQRERELQARISELKSEIKRAEHDRLMEQKDKDTELALLQSTADNLSKKLKDRELALSALRETSLAELQDAKSDFKASRAELIMKHSKEQEEAAKRHEALRTKLENAVHILKEELSAKDMELKLAEERMRGLVASEQQANFFLDDLKGQLEAQILQSRETVGQLEETNQKLHAELQELKGVHHITQLRAEKQGEWNERLVTELKDEIHVLQQRVKQMVSMEQYKVDLNHVRTQSSVTMSEALDEARRAFEAEKKGLLEEIAVLQSKYRTALTDAALNALPDSDERAKLALERDQAVSELQRCRAELEAARSAAGWSEERLRRKEADLARSQAREEETSSELDGLKRSCESLETRVMVLEMEKKNIQQIEESKYQVEIMRLTTLNEELKRLCRRAELPSDPNAPAAGPAGSPEPDAVLRAASALSRVRARRLAAAQQAGGAPAARP